MLLIVLTAFCYFLVLCNKSYLLVQKYLSLFWLQNMFYFFIYLVVLRIGSICVLYLIFVFILNYFYMYSCMSM